MVNNILILMILAAFLPAPLVYILGRSMGKKVSWIVFTVLLGVTIALAGLFSTVQHDVILEEYSWVSAPVSLTFGLLADGLSVPMMFTYLFVSAGATLFSVPYMERRFSLDDIEESNEQWARFYTFFLLYSASVGACMLSTNLIQFFMFFELALVFSWLLIFLFGYGDSKRNSLLYFLWTHIGGGAFLVGILGAYWTVGSFEIADLAHIADYAGAFWVGLALSLGLFVKIGALGFHGWMPDTYSESPAPVSAVLGATSVMLSTYTMSRLLPPFQAVLHDISGWFMLWALATILYAGVMALVQKDTKRLVAYLSMSQMNYCVLGVFTFVPFGVLGAISYSISHGLAIGLLFMVSGALLYRTESRDMTEMGGLAEKLPIVILATLAGFLTIGGVPPAVGFKSKFILLSGAMVRGFESGMLELIVAILAGSLATLITLGYEFRTVWRVFYGDLPEKLKEVKSVPTVMAITLLALGALSIILGIWPALITNPLEVYIEHIFPH
ncbi:MAG: complex I subunit 5 family protein [Candidatus Bathyarchaeota archaeon]|nr:complex I subunit 5 family protein [Candidatus Bathyarchaeota archaeon]